MKEYYQRIWFIGHEGLEIWEGNIDNLLRARSHIQVIGSINILKEKQQNEKNRQLHSGTVVLGVVQ